MLSSNKQYQRYLKTEYRQAQDWYKKFDSKEWIERYIPTLHELLEKNYSKIHPGVYCIQFNDIPVYVGQSVKVDRILVHALNLYREPLNYFGVEEEEIHSGRVKIMVTILKGNLFDKDLRKENELSYINKLKPLLQKNNGTDRCIPNGERRRVIEEVIFNQNKGSIFLQELSRLGRRTPKHSVTQPLTEEGKIETTRQLNEQ